MVESRESSTLNRSIVVIAVILGATALYVADDFFIPAALALVLTSLLWPVVQKLEKWHIPTSVGSALTILGTVAILVGAISGFEPPVRKFVNDLPQTIAKARPKLNSLSASFSKLVGSPARKAPAATTPSMPSKKGTSGTPKDSTVDGTAAKNTIAATRTGADSTTTAGDSTRSTTTDTAASSVTDSSNRLHATEAQRAAPETSGRAIADSSSKAKAKPTDKPSNAGSSFDLSTISSGAPATLSKALGVASSLLGDFIEIMLLAMFVLGAGAAWKKKLAHAVPQSSKQQAIIDTVSEMRSVVSRYLTMLSLINIVQGTVISIALYLLDYPTPWLWGILAFLLEFIPYFGGMVMIALLLTAGLAAGKGSAAVAGPAIYLITTSLQNNIVSPIAYGRQLRLNPAAILAGLMFWYMIWGVAGAFMAVPILAAFNVLATRVPALNGISSFLSD